MAAAVRSHQQSQAQAQSLRAVRAGVRHLFFAGAAAFSGLYVAIYLAG